jgi:hypothetical protein
MASGWVATTPAVSWPDPQAGIKPVGNDRFSAAAEQSDDRTAFDHYDYWMNMRRRRRQLLGNTLEQSECQGDSVSGPASSRW